MSDPDDAHLAEFDFPLEETRASMAQRVKRQPLLPRIRRDLAIGQAVKCGEFRFHRGTLGNLAVDRHLDDAIGDGPRDETMCLDRRHAELPGDRRLGQSAHVIEPGGPEREIFIAVKQDAPPPWRSNSADIEIGNAAIDMRRPEGNALGNLRDDLPVVRLAFLEREFEADFVVLRPAFGKSLE